MTKVIGGRTRKQLVAAKRNIKKAIEHNRHNSTPAQQAARRENIARAREVLAKKIAKRKKEERAAARAAKKAKQ